VIQQRNEYNGLEGQRVGGLNGVEGTGVYKIFSLYAFMYNTYRLIHIYAEYIYLSVCNCTQDYFSYDDRDIYLDRLQLEGCHKKASIYINHSDLTNKA
jgi:hypothetical protein